MRGVWVSVETECAVCVCVVWVNMHIEMCVYVSMFDIHIQTHSGRSGRRDSLFGS